MPDAAARLCVQNNGRSRRQINRSTTAANFAMSHVLGGGASWPWRRRRRCHDTADKATVEDVHVPQDDNIPVRKTRAVRRRKARLPPTRKARRRG